MSDYTNVMRERSGSSKKTEDKDQKELLTFTLTRDEEHERTLIITANSFETNSHVLSNLFYWASVHNSIPSIGDVNR